MTISNLTKMEESYPNGQKTQWEKEKLLLFLQCFQKACFPGASLCGNGLNNFEFTEKCSLLQTKFVTDKKKDGQTETVKQYAPDFSMQGHKNSSLSHYCIS